MNHETRGEKETKDAALLHFTGGEMQAGKNTMNQRMKE